MKGTSNFNHKGATAQPKSPAMGKSPGLTQKHTQQPFSAIAFDHIDPISGFQAELVKNSGTACNKIENNDAIQLFIAGDQRLTNELICYYLECNTGLACSTGTMDDLYSTLDSGAQEKLRIILLDYDSAGVRTMLSGDLRDFLNRLGGRPAIVFNFNAETGIKRWIAHGIRGLLYLTDPSNNMVKAIKAVAEGHMWLPRQAMSACINELSTKTILDGASTRLTQREKQILAILALGKTNAEVAEKLFISPYTVKVHLQNIFKKIGTPNRVKAALWAQNNLDL